jgi:predicted phosphodiesterase
MARRVWIRCIPGTNLSKPKFQGATYVALRERGLNNQQIADELGVSEAAVRRGLHKAGFKPYLIPEPVIKRLDIALEKPIRLDVRKMGPGAITSDFHHPVTNYGLVNTFIDHARDIGAVNWLVVAGDWFNVDALSAFDYKQADADLTKEIYGSSQTMTRLLETFDKVILSWGNHDARVHKSLGYKVPFTTAMRMMFADLDPALFEDRIVLSNLDNVIVDSARGPLMVAHPKAYSSVPLTQARRLASKHLMSVITGHSHHTAIGHDVSGQFVAGELGGFFDKNKVEYLQRTTAFPNWQNGFGFIDRDGYPTIEGQGWSSRIGKRV